MIEPIYQQWYFHRESLARRLVATLIEGTGDPLALMGERRIGKTSFLLNDLVPAAIQKGFATVYVDLWQQREQPLEAINYALQEAIDDLEVPTARVSRRLATSIKKIGLAGGSIDFGEEPTRRRPTDPHLLVDWLLRQLVATARRPVLLMLDEVQELASVASGERIVSAVRAAITRRKDHVRVVLTGSSEVALKELLFRSRAALYEGASTLSFPHLDRDFTRFLVDRVQTRLHRRIDQHELDEAFVRLNHRPRPLIDLILLYVSSEVKSLHRLLNEQLEAQLHDTDFLERWRTLKPLQRLVCSAIARDLPVTAEATRVHYARKLGHSAKKGALSPGSVTSVLRLLQVAHVVTKAGDGRGMYRLDDPLFAEWIRRHDGDES